MDRTTADSPEIRIPAEDARIAQAMTSLDERLACFAEMLRSACRDLATAAAKSVPHARGVSEGAERLSAHLAGQATETSIIVTGEAHPESSASSIAAEQAIAPPAEPPVHAHPEQAVVKSGRAPGKSKGIVAIQNLSGSDQAGRSALSQDDEVFLASLDPETARAIRVMRRVSADEKSMRELLEEYKAKPSARPAAPVQSKKKSWFSRG